MVPLSFVWDCLSLSFKTVTKHRSHNAPYTLGGDCGATGHNRANRHWSLIVSPSPLLVTNVWCIVSKCHRNEIIIIISATKWTVAKLSRMVETQLRRSRDRVARLICKINITAAWHNITTVPQLCLNYLPTVEWQIETVTVKWRVLETTGQQITITLRLHNDNTSAKIETYFLNFCVGKKWNLLIMWQVNRV